MARLRSANEGVRRRFAMLHQRYVELAKKILGQLEQFDGLIRETGQEALSEMAGRKMAAMMSRWCSVSRHRTATALRAEAQRPRHREHHGASAARPSPLDAGPRRHGQKRPLAPTATVSRPSTRLMATMRRI